MSPIDHVFRSPIDIDQVSRTPGYHVRCWL